MIGSPEFYDALDAILAQDIGHRVDKDRMDKIAAEGRTIIECEVCDKANQPLF